MVAREPDVTQERDADLLADIFDASDEDTAKLDTAREYKKTHQ